MEITQGCVHFQLLVQQICKPPARLIVVQNQLLVTDSFYPSAKSRGRKLWSLCKTLLTYNIIFLMLRILSLFRHWKKGNNVEQLCVCTLILGLTFIVMSSLKTLKQRGYDLICGEVRGLKLAGFKLNHHSLRGRLGSFKETLVYVVVGGFFSGFIMCSLFASFYLDYLPVKLTGKFLVDQVSPKIRISFPFFCDILLSLISCIYYSIEVVHAGGNFFFLLLCLMAFCESLNNLTLQLFQQIPVSSRISEDTSDSFVNCLGVYRIIQILIRAMCEAVADFIQPLIVMGVLSAACSGYVCIKLVDHMPLMLYVPASLLLPLCLTINFVLIALAAVPNKSGTRFKLFWKWRLTRKENRLQLLSCPPIGYSFGFVQTFRMKTALSIADVIFNLMASLTLLRIVTP